MEGNIAYQEEYLLAGQLAAAADVSTDTLRHYECKGVLTRPKRASNGYRLYPVEALTRVRLVQRALSAGFTLDELALVLNERDKGGVPCRDVYRLLTAKLSDFEGQLQALTALCDELRKTLSDWDTRLERMGPGSRAGLLENLAANGRGRTPKNGSRKFPPVPKSKRKKEKNDNTYRSKT